MKYGILIALFTAFMLASPASLAMDDDDKPKKSFTIKDIDRAAGKLRRAFCALKNNSSFLTKAKYTLAVEEERERMEEMKASLEAEGKSREISHLQRAMANAQIASRC